MKAFVRKLVRIVAGLLAVAAILHGPPTAAGGSILWYNGDYDGRDTQVNQTGPADGKIYDDFIVPTGFTFTITSVFSNNFEINPTTPGVTPTAAWEIRSGVSAGNGGTLLASGDGVDTLTATGRSIPLPPFANPISEFTNSVSVNVTLGAGMYWLSVAPDVSNENSFIGTTSGANAVGTPPGNDGNSFFSSNFFNNQSFVPTTDPSIEGPGTWDYSMGVVGTAVQTAVPEPSSLVLGLVGLVTSAGCVWARRRTR
jgi:PEP-CTERM motif